jgi:hypothetical protein
MVLGAETHRRLVLAVLAEVTVAVRVLLIQAVQQHSDKVITAAREAAQVMAAVVVVVPS